MSEQQAIKLYPVDEEYKFKLNLRTEANPLFVEHTWRRLPLEDKKSGLDWLTYGKKDTVRTRSVGKAKEHSYENRLAELRLWLANASTVRVKGYPAPIAPDRETEHPVTVETITQIPFAHREKAAELFLDIEIEPLEEDGDDMALLLGDSVTRLQVKHLGHTFVLGLKKSEKQRIYYDSYVRQFGTKKEGKSDLSTYGLKIENAVKCFDNVFEYAEGVSIGGAPYDSGKRADFLREFCPLLKLQAVATLFEQILQDVGN